MPPPATPTALYRCGAPGRRRHNRATPASKRDTNIMANTVGSKVVHELKELLQIALYIYVCLGALLLYTASIAGASSIEFAHLGYAAVKALVLAKFVLLGHWLHLGESRGTGRLIYSVIVQALALWILLIL